MSRQGVRWRFYRLFNEVYIEAYEIIFFVESNLGQSFAKWHGDRQEAGGAQKKAQKIEFFDASRREKGQQEPKSASP